MRSQYRGGRFDTLASNGTPHPSVANVYGIYPLIWVFLVLNDRYRGLIPQQYEL